MKVITRRSRRAPTAAPTPGQLFGLSALVSAVLFGLAGVIGATGYLISVTRSE